MKRIRGAALPFLRKCAPGEYDLILTSPPAWPSPHQRGLATGREATPEAYVSALVATITEARRVCPRVVFILQDVDYRRAASVVTRIVSRTLPNALAFWYHANGEYSWIIAWGCPAVGVVAAPRHPIGDSIFWEWPDELPAAIAADALPNGGRILDPFAGRARALAALPAKYEVTAVDIAQMA